MTPDVSDRFSRIHDHIEPEACDGGSFPLPDRRTSPSFAERHHLGPYDPLSRVPEGSPSGDDDVSSVRAGDTAPRRTLSDNLQPVVGADSDKPEPVRRTLSDRALELVDGPRQDAYGKPLDNMARIGEAWSAVLELDEPIPAWKVALCMCALKTVRAAQGGDLDSLVDLVGYAEIAERARPLPMTSTGLGWEDLGLVGGHDAPDTQATRQGRT